MRRESEFRYSKLANILREQILSQYIKPGEFLYSENELCRYYDISRTSVRKSLEQLQKEGLIIKRVGQGTMVNPDLVIPESKTKVLRIMVPSPSHYVDHGLPHIIEMFKSKYSNVEVKVLSFPINHFKESMLAFQELGNSPDLILVTDRLYEELVITDSFKPLQAEFKDAIGTMYPRLVHGFSKDHLLMAVPTTFSPVFLAYNPQLLAASGVAKPDGKWDVGQFLAIAKQLTIDMDQDGIIEQYGLLLSASSSRWPVIALQNGYTFQPTCTRESLVQTLTLLHDMIYRERVVTFYQGWRSINSDAFINGKVAMMLTTTIELAKWSGEAAFQPKIVPLPFGPVKASLLIANAFMIPKKSQEPELANEFLRFALDPKLQIEIAQKTGFLSCLTINDQKWSDEDLHSLNIFGDEINNCYFLADMFTDPLIIGEIEEEMEMFWAGLESATEFADRLIAILNNKSK